MAGRVLAAANASAGATTASWVVDADAHLIGFYDSTASSVCSTDPSLTSALFFTPTVSAIGEKFILAGGNQAITGIDIFLQLGTKLYFAFGAKGYFLLFLVDAII